MPLIPFAEMLAAAKRGRYAVCYCESWNLESLQAVIEAAEECRAPVIAGFNGGFLGHRSRQKAEDLAYYAGFRLALDRSKVPVVFLFNESDCLSQILESIQLGFNAVMAENETVGLDEYRALVRRIVKVAQPLSVGVEAQIGRLPAGTVHANGSYEITDPELAKRFVAETGIDALGVSVGNVHVLTDGKAAIDLSALRRIHETVDIPLVIHGGTSLPPESMADLIDLGVAKINFGTVLKQLYLEAVRQQLSRYRAPENPHTFLGIGGDQDVMRAGRDALKSKIRELLYLSQSAERAPKDAQAAV